MKRLSEIKFFPYVVLGAAFVAAGGIFFTLGFFMVPGGRNISVEDSIYQKYIQPADPKLVSRTGYKFIPQSQCRSNVAGTVLLKKSFTLLEKHDDKNKAITGEMAKNISPRNYLLKAEPFVPVVKSDLSAKKPMAVTDPKLSVEIASLTGESGPVLLHQDNRRGILLEGRYFDHPEYDLTLNHYAQFVPFGKKAAKSKKLESFLSGVLVAAPCEKLAFTASAGDIMVARGVQDVLLTQKDGVERVFGDTLPVLRNNDLTIGNLEGVVTGRTKNAIKTYTFKFNKKVLPFLQAAGFNYFMQTNNHCYDYGEEGFKDTLAALRESGIPTSGAGYNIQEASEFYHVELKGEKYAVISVGAYPVERSGFDGKKTATATDNRAGILWQSDAVLESVAAEKAAGYTVIVNVHGGEEYHFAPSKSQKEFYQALCDSGASVVFGSHPHVLQPTVWYGDSLIVYSLGNFVFNGMEEMKGGTDSQIVRVGISGGKIVYAESYPAKIIQNGVRLK